MKNFPGLGMQASGFEQKHWKTERERLYEKLHQLRFVLGGKAAEKLETTLQQIKLA